jgi:hypothetical protein
LLHDLAPDVPTEFRTSVDRLLDGYTVGSFSGSAWGVTVKRSKDCRRTWLFAEELGGSDFVSFNLYILSGGRWLLKPCEMSSSKVLEFAVGFVPAAGLKSRKYGPVPLPT